MIISKRIPFVKDIKSTDPLLHKIVDDIHQDE